VGRRIRHPTTNTSYLQDTTLVEHRTRAKEHADSAALAGQERIREINLADVAALDAILTGLDKLAAAPVADEAFDLRELGAA